MIMLILKGFYKVFELIGADRLKEKVYEIAVNMWRKDYKKLKHLEKKCFNHKL